jgi:hypothetical protein
MHPAYAEADCDKKKLVVRQKNLKICASSSSCKKPICFSSFCKHFQIFLSDQILFFKLACFLIQLIQSGVGFELSAPHFPANAVLKNKKQHSFIQKKKK